MLPEKQSYSNGLGMTPEAAVCDANRALDGECQAVFGNEDLAFVAPSYV